MRGVFTAPPESFHQEWGFCQPQPLQAFPQPFLFFLSVYFLWLGTKTYHFLFSPSKVTQTRETMLQLVRGV